MTPKQLRFRRTQRGIKARFIADKLNIPAARLCEMEKGRRDMPQDVAKRYQEALGL